jgi:hypothetical protein
MTFRSSVTALLGIIPLLVVLVAPQTLSAARKSPVARAAVWQATDIPSMDIMAGPAGPGA